MCCGDVNNIKITDFGLSIDVSGPDADARQIAGTPDYMSPEAINYDKLTDKSDMWSVGIIIYRECV